MTDIDREAEVVADTLEGADGALENGHFRSFELKFALTANSDRAYDTRETNAALEVLDEAGYVSHDDTGVSGNDFWSMADYDRDGAYQALTGEEGRPFAALLDEED